MAPSHYLGVHYYERVLTGVTTLLVEKGKRSLEELEALAGGAFPPFESNRTRAHGGELRKEHTNPIEFELKVLWGDPSSQNESVIVEVLNELV